MLQFYAKLDPMKQCDIKGAQPMQHRSKKGKKQILQFQETEFAKLVERKMHKGNHVNFIVLQYQIRCSQSSTERMTVVQSFSNLQSITIRSQFQMRPQCFHHRKITPSMQCSTSKSYYCGIFQKWLDGYFAGVKVMFSAAVVFVILPGVVLVAKPEILLSVILEELE